MTITIKGETRTDFGSNAVGRLRRKDLIPAILYGEGVTNVALVLQKKDIVQVLRSETRENTIFKVALGGRDIRDAMFKAIQVDPTTDEILHADLIQIAMDKAVRIAVPIVHRGEPIGVKTEGGFIDFVTREVEVECLPRDIPERMEIDVSALHINQSVKVSDLALPPGVRILSDPNLVLVVISLPHKEEEFPGEKPEEAAAEATEVKEPEVIKKERAGKEEGEEKEEKKGKEEKKEEKREERKPREEKKERKER
jgi:large subunit ribosomal protein L25